MPDNSLSALKTYTNADVRVPPSKRKQLEALAAEAGGGGTVTTGEAAPYEQGPSIDEILAGAKGTLNRVQEKWGTLNSDPSQSIEDRLRTLQRGQEEDRPLLNDIPRIVQDIASGKVDRSQALQALTESAHTVGLGLDLASIPVSYMGPYGVAAGQGMRMVGTGLMGLDSGRRMVAPEEGESRAGGVVESALLAAPGAYRALKSRTAPLDAEKFAAKEAFKSGSTSTLPGKAAKAAYETRGTGTRGTSGLSSPASKVGQYGDVQAPQVTSRSRALSTLPPVTTAADNVHPTVGPDVGPFYTTPGGRTSTSLEALDAVDLPPMRPGLPPGPPAPKQLPAGPRVIELPASSGDGLVEIPGQGQFYRQSGQRGAGPGLETPGARSVVREKSRVDMQGGGDWSMGQNAPAYPEGQTKLDFSGIPADLGAASRGKVSTLQQLAEAMGDRPLTDVSMPMLAPEVAQRQRSAMEALVAAMRNPVADDAVETIGGTIDEMIPASVDPLYYTKHGYIDQPRRLPHRKGAVQRAVAEAKARALEALKAFGQ